jgi:hypothetical protein
MDILINMPESFPASIRFKFVICNRNEIEKERYGTIKHKLGFELSMETLFVHPLIIIIKLLHSFG